MNNQPLRMTLSGGLRRLPLQLILPGLYFLLIFLFFPFRGVFYMDPDEGIELEKAHLVLRGYSMYSEIWSDQPPLLTDMLSIVLRLFGLRINLARLFILMLTCVFIWVVYRLIRSVWGDFHAVAGVFLVLLLPEFPNLSVSVMAGLPSIIFATISLYFLILWHQRQKTFYLLLSGSFIAFSVLTKLFTAFLIPIFLTGILLDGYSRRAELLTWKRIFSPTLKWLAAFGFFLLLLGLITVKPENLRQLLEVHILARSVPAFTNDESVTLLYHLKNASFIIYLAIMGFIYVLISKRWIFLYPAAWIAAAFVLFVGHRPVWYHQQLLVTIPAAFLGAVACGEATHDLWMFFRRGSKWNFRMMFGILNFSLLLFLLISRVPAAFAPFNSRPSIYSPGLRETSEQVRILNTMMKYASKTNWVITDKPVYAFWAKLSVPPPLVVFTDKRWITNELSENDILEIFQEYQPEQALLTQYIDPKVDQYLQENYQLLYSRGYTRLYVRNDVVMGGQP